jgi:hypothetical protein
MIYLAMESDVSAENASRLQQTLGKPRGFPTDPTATTTTGYSWCPLKRGRSDPRRKHEDTKTRSHHRTAYPLILPADHADNADGRSRKSSAWQGPRRRRTTAGNRCTGTPLRTQAFVAASRFSGLRSRRAQPRHSSSSVDEWRALPLQTMGEGRRNRRAPGASSGGKHGDDGRLRPESTRFAPGAAIARSPTVSPSISELQHQGDYLRLSA